MADIDIILDEKTLQKIKKIIGAKKILGDKGFQGLQNFMTNAILPFKKPKNRSLSLLQYEFNLKISKERILIENFFGRLKVLWTLFGSGYNGHFQYFSERFKVAVHLTNYHIKFFPLRKDKNELGIVIQENQEFEF